MKVIAHFKYYNGQKWTNWNSWSDLHKTHLSPYCIYLLLHNLMCTAKVDVYTHFWADAQLNAFPEFSLTHKCREFEVLISDIPPLNTSRVVKKQMFRHPSELQQRRQY